jgi:hypothetical protein
MSEENEAINPIYTFKRPLVVDGEEIKSIDLSEVENITKNQLKVVLERFNKKKNKVASEYYNDPDCVLEIYCIAAGKPLDFFDNLSGKDYAVLPLTIFGFLAK